MSSLIQPKTQNKRTKLREKFRQIGAVKFFRQIEANQFRFLITSLNLRIQEEIT